jgi:hypothetical protein
MKKYALTACMFASYMIFIVIIFRGETSLVVDVILLTALVLVLFAGWTLTMIVQKERYIANKRTFWMDCILAMVATALVVSLSILKLLS